jgi:hypothetical protein
MAIRSSSVYEAVEGGKKSTFGIFFKLLVTDCGNGGSGISIGDSDHPYITLLQSSASFPIHTTLFFNIELYSLGIKMNSKTPFLNVVLKAPIGSMSFPIFVSNDNSVWHQCALVYPSFE